jgi:glycosyltransferase A (GT-A) superfamily protein (DUF2064 family)
VKTRLCPPLSAEEAAALAACLLDDALALSAACAPALGLEAVLALHPGSACAELARRVPTPFRVVRQRGPDLAARMSWAVREAAAAGCARILLRGSDSPLLDGGALRAALAALEHADLALAPDADGGYGLVALRRPLPGIFAHPTSTASLLAETLAGARSAGLRAALLAPGFDIDTAADLARLARERSPRSVALCPRTYAFLDARRLWPREPA